jgi:antirestriction protein ArdC
MTGRDRVGEAPDAVSRVESAREAVSHAVDELVAQLEAGRSVGLTAYLAAVGRFHRYSFGNILLIMSQRPDATRVAGFHTWKSMGRSVKKGERGIVIIAPMVLKPKEDAKESPDQKPDKVVRFRAAYVFDLAQTEGEALPSLDRTGGDPGPYLATLEAAIRADGIVLETVESLGGADGVSMGGSIRVVAGLTPAERFSGLAHEWAHEILHQADRESRPSRTVRETEAEAVAFVVCHAFGLETGTAAADYIQLYDGNRETLTASLARIQQAASKIIGAVSDPRGAEIEVEASLPVPELVRSLDRRSR